MSGYKTVEDYTDTSVIAHRSTRRYAEKFVADFSDIAGEQTAWNGRESLPIFVTLDVVKSPSGGFDVLQTVVPSVS